MNIRQENYGELIKAGISSQDAEELQRISRALHRLDEHSCNGYQTWKGAWDEEAEKRADKREARLEAKGKEISKKYRRQFYHQSDPRGWSVYLVTTKELNGYDISANYNRGLAVCPH